MCKFTSYECPQGSFCFWKEHNQKVSRTGSQCQSFGPSGFQEPLALLPDLVALSGVSLNFKSFRNTILQLSKEDQQLLAYFDLSGCYASRWQNTTCKSNRSGFLWSGAKAQCDWHRWHCPTKCPGCIVILLSLAFIMAAARLDRPLKRTVSRHANISHNAGSGSQLLARWCDGQAKATRVTRPKTQIQVVRVCRMAGLLSESNPHLCDSEMRAKILQLMISSHHSDYTSECTFGFVDEMIRNTYAQHCLVVGPPIH